jgi:hypothetical protein
MNGIAIQLICHAWGDYVLQNHWMANKKTTEWLPAIVHVILYTVPFLIMFGWHPAALGVIAGTHLVIDHYRLANYWVRFWGTGCEGWVARKLRESRTTRVPRPDLEGCPVVVTGPDRPADAPAWLGVWLMIIVDNIFHVTINALALAYLAS